MKRIALILIASVVALGSLQAQKKQKRTVNLYDVDSVVYVHDTVAVDDEYNKMWKEAWRLHVIYPINGPTKMHNEEYDVTLVMNKIAKLYGAKENVQTESLRQPESGALISSCNIIPFVANIDDRMVIEKAPSTDTYEETDILQLIEEAKQAFRSCNISYNNGYLQSRTYGGAYEVQIAPDKAITLLSPNFDEQLLYMEVKNKENPMLRDLFAVKWESDSTTVSGCLYFITNRRPDLVEKEEKEPASRIMSRWDVDFERHLKLLGRLSDKYESDLKQLNFDIFNTADQKQKKLIRKQIKQLNKKRQEVLDEMHKLIMNYK